MSESQKGRIAIKFGGPSASARPSALKAKIPPSSLGKRPRSGAWGGDDSDDSDAAGGKHEVITGFGAEGAESDKVKEAKKEYVIARQPNRDWKSDARAQRGGGGKDLLPPEARAKRDGKDITMDSEEPAEQKWGLTLMEKKKNSDDDDKEDNKSGDALPKETTLPKQHDNNDDDASATEKAPRTADEEAMDALLGRGPKKAQKIIHTTETDAFQRDVSAAGDESTLADYEAMPVEEFGAALLRGMGWNGEERGSKRKEVKRRPNKLGLGAKELKEAEDLGAWNQGGGNGRRKRPTLNEYRREEERKKESSGRRRDDDGGHRREGDYHRDRGGDRHKDRDRDRNEDRHRHRDRHDERHHHRDHRR